jgi:hypothetical protein
MRLWTVLATALLTFSARAQPANSQALAARMKEYALAYTDRLRDFVCLQVQERSIGNSPAATHWKRLETQESVLEYINHKEHYNLLKVNGETLDPEKRIKRGHFIPGGEFGSFLWLIFKPEAQATFEWDHEETLPGGRACAFRYTVPQSTSTYVMTADADHVRLGHHGMVWADCETGAVTHFRIETDIGEVMRGKTHVPLGERMEVRYAPATVGSEEFLLPQSAEVMGLFYKTWTKSEIRFEQYRKYDANSTIRFDGHF